ncbi:hypothetical protein ACFQ1S_46165, partial [Kibdelosporangium lantanae]
LRTRGLLPWKYQVVISWTGMRSRMVEGCEAEAAGKSITELARRRDAFLVDLLLLLEKHGL